MTFPWLGRISYKRKASVNCTSNKPEPMSLTDNEIVDAVLAGQKHLFAELVQRYQQPVYNLMYRYALHADVAADLTQDVFVRAFGRLALFKPQQSFFSWLYTMAVNLARDWSRKRTRRHTFLRLFRQQAGEAGHRPCQQAVLEQKETRDMLEVALSKLAEETREILILRYRHEQPIQEISRIFNLSDSAVKMRIKRGLEQMQGILQEMSIHGAETYDIRKDRGIALPVH